MLLDTVADRLSVLANPLRLRLLHVLFRGQDRRWPVGDLVTVLRAPQPTVSRHLKELLDAGLVDVIADGRRRLYALVETQAPLDRQLLGSLEAVVAGSPEAAEDLARMPLTADAAPPAARRLTSPDRHASNILHMEIGHEPERERARSNQVFRALAHETRRLLLDVIERHPGCTVAFASAFVDASRQAVDQHLAVLEAAELVVSRRSGRERHLHYNAVPLQLAYERWTDSTSAPIAGYLSELKHQVEGAVSIVPGPDRTDPTDPPSEE